MSSFTPGPWMAAARPSSVVGWPVVSPADMGRSVCNVTLGHEASAANARLIAAAPDMLAALSAMVAVARKQSPKWSKSVEPDGDSPLGLALAALAKAEGRS